jgi:hypothetical protein
MFKNKELTKQKPILPTLKARGSIQVEYIPSISNQTPYETGKQRELADQPSKVTDYSKTFA